MVRESGARDYVSGAREYVVVHEYEWCMSTSGAREQYEWCMSTSGAREQYEWCTRLRSGARE